MILMLQLLNAMSYFHSTTDVRRSVDQRQTVFGSSATLLSATGRVGSESDGGVPVPNTGFT